MQINIWLYKHMNLQPSALLSAGETLKFLSCHYWITAGSRRKGQRMLIGNICMLITVTRYLCPCTSTQNGKVDFLCAVSGATSKARAGVTRAVHARLNCRHKVTLTGSSCGSAPQAVTLYTSHLLKCVHRSEESGVRASRPKDNCTICWVLLTFRVGSFLALPLRLPEIYIAIRMLRVFGTALVMPCPATTAEMRAAPASGWTLLPGTTPKVTDWIMWNVVIEWRTIVHGRGTACCPHLMPAQVHRLRKETGGSRALGWVCSGSLWCTERKAAGETRATGGFRTTCTTCWRDPDHGLLSTTLLCKCSVY